MAAPPRSTSTARSTCNRAPAASATDPAHHPAGPAIAVPGRPRRPRVRPEDADDRIGAHEASGRVNGVDFDDLLVDPWDVRLDVLVEPAVVLLLGLPDLGDGERAIVIKGNVVHEARLGLELLDERGRNLVVLRRTHPRDTVPD